MTKWRSQARGSYKLVIFTPWTILITASYCRLGVTVAFKFNEPQTRSWEWREDGRVVDSWEQLPIDIQYLDWRIICRSTYSMSIHIHNMYVDRHTVCQLTYCMSIEIHQCMYTWCVCWSTYCMSINILYVNRDTVCRSAVVPNWLKDIDMECSSVNMGWKKKPVDSTQTRFFLDGARVYLGENHHEVAEKNMELLNMEHTSCFQMSLNLNCLDIDFWESIFGDKLY